MKKFVLILLQALHLIAADTKKVIAVSLEVTEKILGLLQLPIVDNVMAVVFPEITTMLPGIEKALSRAISAMNSADADVDILTVEGETEIDKIEAQLSAFLMAWQKETPLVKKAISEKLATVLVQILEAEPNEAHTGAIVAAAIAKGSN